MPILTDDIKLKKSAVMADVPEGGGGMTGVDVIDGQSNNLFPDSSQVDWAIGRAQIRKVFGVAHTSDTNTLLGAHAIITVPPVDPLVHCALFKTAGWADTRSAAQTAIEKYLVKGPRIAYRLYDTHYALSRQIRLISLVGGTAPSGGDTLVLRNPDGVEQFVRILRATLSSEPIAVVEGGGTVMLTASVLTCDISNKLDHDFLGPPAMRVGLVETSWAQVYSTNLAGGTEFCGIKKLGVAGMPGDYSLMTDSGIYAPIVPAATIETPMTDVQPYARRTTTNPTGYTSISVPVVNMAVGPGVVLTAHGPISPKTLVIMLGAIQCMEVGDGVLLQGATPVGTVSYSTGTATFSGSAPSYGVVAVSLAYRPATAVAAEPHSAAFTVTTANQGTGYVNAFSPPPAPGTFALDYMTQGRWYTLTDAALYGKLSGGSSGYGIGNLNYETGSMAATLGALPDVGSVLLASYGSAASAAAYDLGTVPVALSAIIETPWDKPIGTVRWISGGVAKSATPAGGDAALVQLFGTPTAQRWRFTPTSFPDTGVTVDYILTTPHSATVITPHTVITPSSTDFLSNGDASFTLVDVVSTPMAEGSFSALMRFVNPLNAVHPESDFFAWLYDKGGRVFSVLGTPAGSQTVDLGSINYATGQIVLSPTFNLPMWLRVYTAPPGSAWYVQGTYSNYIGQGAVTTGTISDVLYQIGAKSVTTYTSDDVITYTDATATAPVTLGGWTLELPSSPSADAVNAAVFSVGGSLYTCVAGVLRSGWSVKTSLPSVANAGSLSSAGVLSFAAVPAGGQNLVTWANLTRDISSGLVDGGVFRTRSAPLKTGVLQLQSGEVIGSANDAGQLTGGYTGSFDALRGVVRWTGAPVVPETLTYNAVAIGYLPLDASILGLDTVRLPLDGRVPIYREGGLVLVHHTAPLQLPNPLVKGTDYDLGRVRIAYVRVKNALGATVPRTLYTTDLDPGTFTVPVDRDITAHPQPWTVFHRIEDMVMVNTADISGKLSVSPNLTHNYPLGSYVSSVLLFGDLFARVANYIDQQTWTGAWSDELIGAAPLANFNQTDYPVAVTNRGAISERWALIFTSSMQFRIIGEHVGQVGTGDINTDCAPVNPATGAAYFTVPALGWGGGWSAGNVERFDTYACGAPIHVLRTILQGRYTEKSDQFEMAFRGDVNA